ncbi:two-partner secretion domain-containing protein [Photobacterium sp. 53610]|uniref:two-partner secretion domain-containing protein n=1 Tax=Photobacterium sp. 53610 TaxID=3102789 RepID=UPI002EDAF434
MLTSIFLLPTITFASLTSTNTKIVSSKYSDLQNDETLVFMGSLSSDGTAHVQVATDGKTVKRLLLVNNPIINKGVKNKPAQATVIQNTSAKPLAISKVEVLGPPSDIIIASPSGLICDSCEFKNAKRVVLATGIPSFNQGNLTSIKTQEGLLDIVGSGLKTQDAVFVDLFANSINVLGEINTFTRVNKNSTGGYDVAPSTGNRLASQGNLQLITGNTELSYESGDINITNASQTDSALKIQGDITAGNVLIQTTSLNTSATLQGNITTLGDISLVNTYHDITVIPGGNIHIKSFGSLTLNENKLLTKSNVILEASNISIIPREEYKDYSIKAGNIEISSENSLLMKGLIFADNIKVAANMVNNSGGELFALESLYVNGISYINNNSQGLFIGSNVALSSSNSIINGILKPWFCKPLDSFRNAHIKSDTVQLGSGVGLVKSFINSCTGSNIIQDWELEERKASIFGFNISLNAPEIINSNPYIKQRSGYDEPEVKMEITDSNTVSISAENSLVIQAKNSFKNGSGVVEVLNGNMSIDTPIIYNQRYYIKGLTHRYTREIPFTPPKHCPELLQKIKKITDITLTKIILKKRYKKECQTNTTITEKVTTQYVSSLSPVARILVAGNITFNGDKFFNEASNVEVWGQLNGKLSEIKSLGLALNEKIVKKTVTHHSRRYCSRRVLGACIKRKTERWTTTSQQLVKNETAGQFPALFDVNKANINVANGKVLTGNITFGK